MLYVLPLVLLPLLVLPGCNLVRNVPEKKLESVRQGEMVRFFYPSSGGQVEAYITRPHAAAPTPLVILLHGHSLAGRGAVQVLRAAGTLSDDLCLTTLAISLPGYGATDVPSGSIPTVTRQVVLDGLALTQKLSWVDAQKVFFYGVSRGAIVASALVKDVENLRGAILVSGAYDLERLYKESTNFWLRSLLNPNGETNPKFMNLVTDPSRWHVPTLIMHGAADKLIPAQQARQLQQRLQAAGTASRLVVYPDQGHLLPLRVSKEATVNFLNEITGAACPAGAQVS